MKKFSIIFSILVFLTGTAFADVYEHPATLKSISNQIPEINSIKCNFKQEKQIKNIKKPLVSGGDFEFIKNEGVHFYTKYPVQSKVDYTNKNYRQINDIVKAISNKKYSRIEKDFDFFYTENQKNWTFGMKPKKNSDAYNYISSITLNGIDYINKISILQTNGNKTVIWFTK